jgi:hypothetical protein
MVEISTRPSYDGPIAVGMVFDFEPGKKHLYERLTISRIEGAHIWAFGRSGMTYYEEPDFRQRVVFISNEAPTKRTVPPQSQQGRYEGPIAVGMVFDFEAGKKHLYERLTISKVVGPRIWAFGRSGMTYYEEDDFRDSVARVPAES